MGDVLHTVVVSVTFLNNNSQEGVYITSNVF